MRNSTAANDKQKTGLQESITEEIKKPSAKEIYHKHEGKACTGCTGLCCNNKKSPDNKITPATSEG